MTCKPTHFFILQKLYAQNTCFTHVSFLKILPTLVLKQIDNIVLPFFNVDIILAPGYVSR